MEKIEEYLKMLIISFKLRNIGHGWLKVEEGERRTVLINESEHQTHRGSFSIYQALVSVLDALLRILKVNNRGPDLFVKGVGGL